MNRAIYLVVLALPTILLSGCVCPPSRPDDSSVVANKSLPAESPITGHILQEQTEDFFRFCSQKKSSEYADVCTKAKQTFIKGYTVDNYLEVFKNHLHGAIGDKGHTDLFYVFLFVGDDGMNQRIVELLLEIKTGIVVEVRKVRGGY